MINDKTLTWTFFLIDILVLWVLYYTGNIIFIIDNDISNIAIIIISIYFVSNLLFFKMAFSKATYLPDLEYIKNILSTISNSLIMAGFIGTLLGIMVAFYNLFVGIDLSNFSQSQEIIAQMSNGLGIAFITSLAGMVSGLLIHIKLSVLGYE